MIGVVVVLSNCTEIVSTHTSRAVGPAFKNSVLAPLMSSKYDVISSDVTVLWCQEFQSSADVDIQITRS